MAIIWHTIENKVGGIISPLPLTRFWHRRLAEAAMFVAGLVVFLYFLPMVTVFGSLGRSLIVSDTGVTVAVLTFVVSFVLYLWAPKKHIVYYSLAIYLLLAATCGVLMLSTGGIDSPFLALWICIGVFAAVFGWLGILPILATAVVYGVYLYIDHLFGSSRIVVLAVAGVAPVIASYFIWHTTGKRKQPDNAYEELATKLSSANSKADTVINAIGDGVIAISSKDQIELINPAAQRILGWTGGDALNLDYHSVLKLTDKNDKPLEQATDPIQIVLAGNREIDTSDFTATTEAGKKVLLSLVVSPVGQPGQGAIIVFRDVTAEKKAEREQSEFISTASHEMRTPVASIEGYLGLALNPNTAQIDAKARDFIEKAHASAQHLGRLFQDLLDVSRADDGRLSNHPSVVDVIAFTQEIVDGLRPKAEEKHLRLYYKPRPDDEEDSRQISPVFYVTVDNDHLREVLSNLVENAIKYTLSGDVTVDVTGDDTHVKISIADSGIGIPREDIPHLFQKFYRVDNSATREIGGTGLGLYLCRRLVEVMSGRIWVESEFKKGSIFYVELPRISREEAMHALEAAASEPAEAVNPPEASTIEVPTQAATPAPAITPQPAPASTPASSNIPLSQIEQNPRAYLTNRDGSLQVPVRPENSQNKP